MSELVERLPPEGNYEFRLEESRGSRVKLFAPHGGCIERCTDRLVHEIARGDLDYFIFLGKRRTRCYETLHVTSTHYDEPRCLDMARRSEVAVAIHGCSGNARFIEVGGGNPRLVSGLRACLQHAGYRARVGPPSRRGADERNFINLARSGGVQMELSAGFRRSLFSRLSPALEPDPTALRAFVGVVRGWLLQLEGQPPGVARRLERPFEHGAPVSG